MKISFRRAVALQFLVLIVAAQLASAPPLAANDLELAQKIDALFADLDSVKSPGCALGVIRDGDLIYRRGYGMASLEHGLPIDERTVFYTGSVSKQFVAAAVAMAVREGHLSLDDGLRRWFPELPEYAEPITVRHLVHHISGLRDYLGLMSLAGVPFENVITPKWVLALIARQKAPNFAPGERQVADLFLPEGEREGGETIDSPATEGVAETEGVPLTAAQIDAWVGEYEILPGIVLAFARDDDGLLLTTPDGDSRQVAALSASELRIVGVEPPITDPLVRLNSDGDQTSLTMELYGDEITAPRLASPIHGSADLQAWVGSYWSEELAVTAVLAIADGKLTYQIGSSEPRELRARTDRSFSWPGMRARGELGRDGKIAAFVVDAGRVQGIRFERDK